MANVAIIGYGWVGRSMKELFPGAMIYSPSYSGSVTKDEASKADVAFVSVPTPCPSKGFLDTSIVEDCVAWCKCPLIVIRSTVNPGDSDNWAQKYNKHIVVQPEYLGETPQHPMLNPKTRQFLIIGGEPEDRRKLIELYTEVYNANIAIRQVSRIEAEIIKMSENRAIAFKVAECQELYDACEAAHVDYYTIRDAVYGDDPRMSLWWTFIMPQKRGFQSKCIPKDVYGWAMWAETFGYDAEITKKILERNERWISQS